MDQGYWNGGGFRASKKMALTFSTWRQARRALPRALRATAASAAPYEPKIFRRGPVKRGKGS